MALNKKIINICLTFFVGLFLYIPGVSFAADWLNIGYQDTNIKTAYVNPKNNKQILVNLNNSLSNQVFYTEDGGATWKQSSLSGSTAISTSCSSFLINKNNSKEVWAGCGQGLFRSIDGGAIFARIEPKFKFANVVNVAADSNGVIYVNYNNNYLSKTADGLIWEDIVVPGSTSYQRLFIAPGSSDIYISKYGGTGFGLYRSVNSGVSWQLLKNNQNINGGVDSMIVNGSNICLANTNGLICSSDNGLSWGQPFTPNNELLARPRAFNIIQNPDEAANQLVITSKWDGSDLRLYSLKSGQGNWDAMALPAKTSSLSISQGVVYAWSPNSNWLSGLWRNDGIAVMPEYLKKHPVIIVPGILGSWRVKPTSDFVLDPIFNKYSDLCKAFESNGYRDGELLFKFPYDWRRSNIETAQLLKKKINDAKLKTGSAKVDIVAHSMGGLVSREYVESSYYENDVNKIIFLGTPHLGSPESYFSWVGGDLKFGKSLMVGALFEYIFKEEAEKNDYVGEYGLFNYLREKVTSVGQLISINNYLINQYNNEVQNYPYGYPRNEFVENLDKNKNIIIGKGVDVTNIITGDISTVSSIKVAETSGYGPLWEFGLPQGYYNNYSGIGYGLGDGTVPIESALGLMGKTVYKSKIGHADLPKYSVSDILCELNINCSPVDIPANNHKQLLVKAYSPINFYVETPDGKKIGFQNSVGDVNEIEGAFYSGSSSLAEFALIPNPVSGQYKVHVIGTEKGEYKIETTYFNEELNTENTDSYSGTTFVGQEDLVLSNFLLESGSVEVRVEDNIAPLTSLTLRGDHNNGYYRTSVEVTLESTDDKSGVKKTEYGFDGLVWSEYKDPVIINNEGENHIYYRSVDNNDNTEEIKLISFKIDSQAPALQLEVNNENLTRWDMLSVVCSVNDNNSGIENTALFFGDKNISCGSKIDMRDYTPGVYQLIFTAKDKAGNESTIKKSIKVVVTYNSFSSDMVWMYKNGDISNYGLLVSSLVKIRFAELFDVFNQDARASKILTDLRSDFEKHYSKGKISERAYNLFVENINYLLEVK